LRDQDRFLAVADHGRDLPRFRADSQQSLQAEIGTPSGRRRQVGQAARATSRDIKGEAFG